MANNLQEFQEDIDEFFKDVDDTKFLLFIGWFVYHNQSKSASVIKIFSDYLEHTGLTEYWELYDSDYNNPQKNFLSCPISARGMFEDLKYVLLSVSYWRFRKCLVEKK